MHFYRYIMLRDLIYDPRLENFYLQHDKNTIFIKIVVIRLIIIQIYTKAEYHYFIQSRYIRLNLNL